MNMTLSWTEGSATGDGTTVVQVSRLELRREGEVVVQQSGRSEQVLRDLIDGGPAAISLTHPIEFADDARKG